MFGSRKKGNKKQYTPQWPVANKMSAQPPTASSVNPSAATAAVSAYNNLSSAAAAAALRNLPAAPTNVGAVQTKRTMRRSASVSSEGSRRALSPVPSIKRAMGFGGGTKDTREGVVVSPTGAPTLRRRGSSSSIRSMSSMTERTFRSPSPHQSRNPALAAAITASPSGSVASSNNQSMNAAGAAAAMAAGRSSGSRSRSVPPPPPVPIIPKHVIESQPKQQPQQKQTQQTEKQSRRATTLGLVQQPLRLASQKQKTGRSSWFGSAAVGDRSSIRSSDTAMDVVGNAQQQERPGSRNSLHNFSYPSRQRLGSPPPSPTATRSTPIAPATAAALAVAPPPAGKLPRSASTERVPTTQPRSQQKAAAASARRSASTSRVTGRYYDAELSDQTLVYDANSRRMVPRGELLMREEREYAILEAAERPLQQQRKKKQQRSTANASLAGTHFSQGTMTHSHGSAAPLNRAELERMKEPAPQQQPAAVAAAVKAAPKTPKSPPPERRLPKIETTSLETPAAVAAATTAAAEPAVAERDFEEAAQPLPALSTSASTPSSSVSSLTALAASQAATSPVAIQSISSPEDGSFEGTLLTEDGRPVLVKRPSIVREDPEGEAEEEKLSTSAAVVAAAAGSRTARDDLDGVSTAKHIHHDSDNATQQASPAVTKQAQPVLTKPNEKERTRSNSPVRTAHFSPVVSVVGSTNLSVRRHSPPPRSISPRKSALKQSSSPRDASPSDSASEANHSLQGDLTLHNRKKANRVSFDDKAVVVSQSPMPPSPPHSPGLSTLPGASEAPPTSNAAHQPPSRSRSWFSNIGRSKKKSDHSSANNFEDDDVVMKPRPALPSFGSVRDKSHPAQQQEERALVRPINDSQPAHQATQSPTPAETHNTSSDHAIGYIIGAGAAAGAAGAAVASAERQSTPPSSSTGNTANTSRYREPLPPVVTSVDGSGYVSDSGASSDGDDEVEEEQEHSPVLRFDEEQDTTVPGNLDDEPIIPGAPATDDNDQIIILPSPSSPGKSPKKTVPAIAISHPSQENLTAVRGTENDETDGELDQEEVAETEDQLTAIAAPATPAAAVAKSSPVRSLFDVPGMFPADTDSDGTTKSSPTQAAFANANVNSAVPTRQNAFEPIVQDDDNSYSPQMPATVFATHMPTLHEETSLRNEKLDEDDSDSEVFSDAYEDLSDIEGDGFLSLDAVVDGLIVPDMVKSPFASSPLTGSPSRKAETLQLGSSPLAKEAGTAPPDTTALTSAAAAGGAVIGMTALTSTAIHKQVNGDAKAGPEDEEDWDKIKAFWRSLTVEKRAQLEKEALQDAADEGDLEDESAAADKKPRRKKSVETRLAEKKAIQELTPAQKTQKAVDVAPAATKANKAPAAAAAATTPAPAPIESKSQKPAATRIRKSMRDNAPRATAAAPGAGAPASPDFKTSLRPNPPAQKERTASAFPPKAAVGAINRPQALHSRTMSADSTASSIQGKSGGMAGLLPSALRRRGSDSSESSFRRARSNSNGAATSGFGAGAAAGAAGAAGGFRMSMRGDSKSSAAAAAASNNANGNLNHRSSRFSLRSLSPTGSTTLRGSTESSPQFRRSMRDGSGGTGFTPMDIKRMSSPGPMANSTLRKGAADSGGGFFSSLGKKRGGKLLQRSKESGGGKAGRSRFGDSSDDDDDDIFGPTSRAPAGGGMAANRRSVSTGGAYTFRSRFVDSSDEDEEIPDHRTVGQNKNKDHVVPKTLRTGSSMRSASARPASSSTPLSPLLPEELEEEEEEQNTRAKTTQNGISAASYSGAGASSSAANVGNNNLGTSTLRRSRSGRGQIAPVSPMYSPTTTGAVGLNTGSNATPTRRSGGIMSVLRRKKNDGPSSPTSFSNGSANKIQRAGLVDSAARRDTQLERSTAELAAVRSNSIGSQNRRVLGGSGSNTPRFVPQNDDSDDDLDDSEDSPVAVRRNNTAPPAHVRTASWPLPDQHTVNITAADLNNEKKKKKFPGLRRMFRLDD